MALNPSERKRRKSIDEPHNLSEDLPTDSDSELRLVLLGKTGSGKSSTGNTILGKQAFKVPSLFEEGTRKGVKVCSIVNGRRVWVTDTPGVFSPDMSNDEVQVLIEEAVGLVSPGVHVFLLVIRLDVKFTEEEQKTVSWIVENFGEEAQKHIIVLFTHGKELQDKTIEQYLHFNPELKGVVESMAGYHVFENANEDDETQVSELLQKINKMVENNGNQIYTKEMYSEVQRNKEVNTFMKYARVAGAVGASVLGVAAAAGASGGVHVIAVAAAGVVIATGALALAMRTATWAMRAMGWWGSEKNKRNI